MNAIFFFAKRAFHSTLRVGRPLLSRHGLTAARFDLLYVVHQYPYGMLQSDLRRALGVTAPTVSRMLRSLEELGFLGRERSCDKRQKRVKLTRDGIVRLRRAISAAIGSGAVQLAVDVALAGERAHDDSVCFMEMCNAESVLTRITRAFLDVATLRYFWHPDD